MKQVKPPVTNRQVRPARQQLQPYRPAEFRGPDDLWVGTNVHVMVIMVNERQLKGLPAQEYVAGGQKEIKLVYPTEGSHLAPEGMFIIKGAKNLDAAKALYDGLLSKESQEAAATDYEAVVAAWNQAVAKAK